MNGKVFRIMGTLVILALVVPVLSVHAGAPAGTWVTGIACQNLDTTEAASVQFTFYREDDPDPVVTYSDPTAIPAGTSRGYWSPTSFGLPAGYVGSAVLASTTAMACTMNSQTNSVGTSTDPYRVGSSRAFDSNQVSDTLYVPQADRNYSGWNSYIAIQNSETTEVAVTVTYKDSNGVAIPAATDNLTIPGGSNNILYANDNPDLPVVFSAVISSDDGSSRLAATVNTYWDATSVGRSTITSYGAFGETGNSNTIRYPRLMRKYYGYNSGITIQNIGPDAITIQIIFYFDGVAYTYTSGSIASSASKVLYLPNVTELDPVDALSESKRTGSAVATVLSGTGPIVGIENENNPGGAGIPTERVGQGGTYEAIADGAQSTTVSFPQFTKYAGGVYAGGFAVFNTTATATTCDISYDNDTDANENDIPLVANSKIERYGPNVVNLNTGYNASVTVTCGQDVVGIINNASALGTGKQGDSLFLNIGTNK